MDCDAPFPIRERLNRSSSVGPSFPPYVRRISAAVRAVVAKVGRCWQNETSIAGMWNERDARQRPATTARDNGGWDHAATTFRRVTQTSDEHRFVLLTTIPNHEPDFLLGKFGLEHRHA